MKIFNSTSDVSKQSQSMGEVISQETKQTTTILGGLFTFSNANLSDDKVLQVKGKIDSSKYVGDNKSKSEVEETINYIRTKRKYAWKFL